MKMKIIDQNALDRLTAAAADSPRLRKNLNLHDDYADPCQRLFNALEPGSYIRPHRHLNPPKPECFLAVRGKMALITFTDSGDVDAVVPFGKGCEALAVDLPAGVWHTLLALRPGSVFFEPKAGPYVPLSEKDFAPWAPAEESPESADYLADLLIRIGHD